MLRMELRIKVYQFLDLLGVRVPISHIAILVIMGYPKTATTTGVRTARMNRRLI